MKRVLSFVLMVLMLLTVIPAVAEEAITVVEIQKYGNLALSVKGSELLNQGYEYGDIVTVTIGGKAFDMPIGSNYADVDQGSPICRIVVKPDTEEDYTVLAINMGDLATASGIATKETTEADPGYIWHLNEGVGDPVTVTIAMKEKGGYYDQWIIHQMVRSEKREDYPNLSDAEFANFRAITTTGVGEHKLYRSSSPVNPEIQRNTYADHAAEAAGIKTVVNLADNAEVMKGYEGYADSYYSKLEVIPLNLGVDFAADEFRAGLAEGLRFIASHDGPYLVHCNEGKDRAGYVSAVIESLMGASLEEVIADYMVTYYNYYNVEPGTDQYDLIADSNICKSLAAAFDVPDIREADLKAEAEFYLQEIGLSDEEIAQVQAKLAP